MKKLLMAASLMLLAACSTAGHRFDPAIIDTFQPGVTTFAQVKAKLGEPKTVTYANDGRELVQWGYVSSSIVHVDGSMVSIIFDSSGKMIRIAGRSTI